MNYRKKRNKLIDLNSLFVHTKMLSKNSKDKKIVILIPQETLKVMFYKDTLAFQSKKIIKVN